MLVTRHEGGHREGLMARPNAQEVIAYLRSDCVEWSFNGETIEYRSGPVQSNNQRVSRVISSIGGGVDVLYSMSIHPSEPFPDAELDVVGAVEGLSDASPEWLIAGISTPIVGSGPGDGPYSTARDWLMSVWRCDDGTTYRMVVPAPKELALEGDEYTLDTEAEEVIEWAGVMVAWACNRNGSRVTGLVKGWRYRT